MDPRFFRKYLDVLTESEFSPTPGEDVEASQSALKPGSLVHVKNYQGVGKIHRIVHAGEVQVIMPNNRRAVVPMKDITPATADAKFEPTVNFGP